MFFLYVFFIATNMDYIRQIYAHPRNKEHVVNLIDASLKKQFNMNVQNIPDIDTQIKKYMYKSYVAFKTKNSNMSHQDIYKSIDPYDAVEELNNGAIESFLQYYVTDFTSKQNIYSNSHTTSGNYCNFNDDSFNSASTFLTDQQKEQEAHIQNIMMRTVDTDAYFENRNNLMSDIYKDQGFNPRELHKNMVLNYEKNKQLAHKYTFGKNVDKTNF